ncbi:MAG: nitroreductase family protein [Porphyromonadaceae bacterium]|nr:nitroreductase family protein [Porphyromonadaceae bacterium]
MTLDILKNRRTVRQYERKDIPEQLLEELLETACRASNTGNMQTYSVVITRTTEIKKKLAPIHFNQPMIMEAPVVLTFCADYNRFIKWCKLRHAEPGYDNFQSFFSASIDALLVAQQFCTAAEIKGLGICYLGTTTYNTDQIIQALDLPKYVIPVATVTVGYPAAQTEQVERLPLEAIIHQERYHDYTSEDIDRLYREKEALPANQGFVAENGKETLAQVFTDIRYTRAGNEQSSKVLLKAIKDQGFTF